MRALPVLFAAFLVLSLPALAMYGPLATGLPASDTPKQTYPKQSYPKQSYEEAQDMAKVMFRRLTGVPIFVSDPRLGQMADLIQNGRAREAAAIATKDPAFYQVTVKSFAAEISSRSETPYIGLDDIQATFIGTVRDELDARWLLSGNYLYRAKPELQSKVSVEPSRRSNEHYEQIDQSHLDYQVVLVKQEPQWQGYEAMRNHAGVMTTRGWGWNYDAGTNRRAVQYAFDRFLCKPIAAWKVPGLDESAVARDVPRNPSKNPAMFTEQYEKVFRQQCLTCHGGIDPMRDAFSSLDFLSGALVELPPFRPAPKYKRGSKAYPEGHVTRDDSWINPIAPLRPELGFKPEQTQGQGVQAFGEMIANASAFGFCMAQRVFESVCQREPVASDSALMDHLASDFEQNGHNLKKLFEETAVSSACLETTGVKTFRSTYYALSRVLGVQPTKEIDEYFQANMTRLPKDGRIEEISASMLLAVKGLASLYCREFTRQTAQENEKSADEDNVALLSSISQNISRKIYGRELTLAESRIVDGLMTEALKSGRDPTFAACTAMASSVEFQVQ